MKSSKIALALAALLATGSVAPAFADDDSGVDKAANASLIVTRIGGLGAGLVVGAPIAIVRETTRSYRGLTESAADKVGGKDFGPSCLLVSLVTLPASLVVGGAKGTYIGSRNAMKHGFNDPFNSDSFSVGKLEE
ncbi:MAG: hypothetical protein JST89_12320 [Cyanobacteria bacterium SZAS-4]|nr:hypothetical protein [Cyanobacteria bacterium SZAS-4]